MIHRIWFFMILAIVLPDVYIYLHYRRFLALRKPGNLRQRILRVVWWLPCMAMVVYTIAMATARNFAPANLTWLNTYLFLFGLFIGPKAVFALVSCIGSGARRIMNTRHNYGHWLGLLLGTVAVTAYVYGLTIGVGRIKVNHVELAFSDLPSEFDGFRILHISDLHVGTFEGWRSRILMAEIDSINAQKDIELVCFTGDMQNMRPDEVARTMSVLSRLPYTYFILGNHDYDRYVRSAPGIGDRMRQQLLSLESRLGRTLCNENIRITRGKGEIWLAGEENDGKPPFPSHADLQKAMHGIPDTAFVILMQHDPSAWQRNILPNCHAQLTLSGHTHGGQMQLFGWRPTMGIFKKNNDCGLYKDHNRYLYVSAGLGGFVPFRLNMPNEITVITLHTKK